MHSKTLEYENPHFLHSLFANDEDLLKIVEEKAGVRVTTRDGWVKFEGGESGVGTACKIFGELERARREGSEINEHAFRFAVDSATAGGKVSDERLGDLMSAKLLGSAQRPPVVPKTLGQLRYLRAMDDHPVVFGVGPAGTGKTYLAMAKALASLKERQVNRVILSRPAVEAGEALGFLPGDLQEKISPYLRPLYDAIYDMVEPAEVEKLIERGVIEIAPLAYMRGRTLNRCYVILDEAQNTTREQMLMFLTRLGDGARCVVTGDPSQVDLRSGTRSGLQEALQVLRGVQGVEVSEFSRTDVVRHPVVKRIIDAYARAREKGDRRGGSSRPDAGVEPERGGDRDIANSGALS